MHGQVKVRKLEEDEDFFYHSNITIYFAEGNHGDSLLFDGIDGELAHSYSLSNTKSPFRGHVHLDDAENWNKSIIFNKINTTKSPIVFLIFILNCQR
jgi:hypothetical protein